jgi:predicted SAM-dependent methyltransferase
MRFLNLGCGTRTHPAWTNVDFKARVEGVIEHDLLKGLPFADESFDAVYHSHLLEHLPKLYAPKFLKECFRVLKKAGIIRVAVPDLERICRLYLSLLEEADKGNEEARNKYDWILLEMFDQMVRNKPGGEMLEYWKQNPMPAEAFVIERVGSEVLNVLKNLRGKPLAGTATKAEHAAVGCDDPIGIGNFRVSGEVHQWMYDRYSLKSLLKRAGFTQIRRCTANESSIPDFNSYLLDIEAGGSVRKPDSLFMEGEKL